MLAVSSFFGQALLAQTDHFCRLAALDYHHSIDIGHDDVTGMNDRSGANDVDIHRTGGFFDGSIE